MEEIELQIMDVVRKKDKDTGGNNGNFFGDFDHLLKMTIPERNTFLSGMVDRKLIIIRQGGNARMIMLPR